MADTIQSYVGSFTTPGAGVLTPQTISGIVDRNGVAFAPKVVIFYGNVNGFFDSSDLLQQSFFSYGIDDGTTALGYATECRWAFGVTWIGSSGGGNSIVQGVSYIFERFATSGKITALASGQFTYTLNLNEFGAATFNYIALGGADLQYYIGSKAFGPATGSFSETGTSFTPTAGFFFPKLVGSTNAWGARPSIGFVDQNLNQVAASAAMKDGDTVANAYRYQRTNQVGLGVDGQTGTTYNTLAVTQWNSNGFTASFTSGGIPDWSYLLLGGCSSQVGSFLQPSSNTVTNITTSSMEPRAALFLSVGGAASTSRQYDTKFSFGTSDGTRGGGAWIACLNGATDAAVSGKGGQSWGGTSFNVFEPTPWSLVTSTQRSAATFFFSTVTTNAVTTTGAKLIIIKYAYAAGRTALITDSKGNTWTINNSTPGGSSGLSNGLGVAYCINPTVGTNHTFTITDSTGGNTGPALIVYAYSNSGTILFDQQKSAFNGSHTTWKPSFMSTSDVIAPGKRGALVIDSWKIDTTAPVGTISVDSGYTMGPGPTTLGSMTSAWRAQVEITPDNPIFSWSGTSAGAFTEQVVSFTGGNTTTVTGAAFLLATPVDAFSSHSTVDGVFNVTSFTPESVSGLWNSVNGTQAEILYMVIGPAYTAPGVPGIAAPVETNSPRWELLRFDAKVTVGETR